MRVLALTHGDGSNRTFQKLVESMRSSGHDITVVAWDREGSRGPKATIDGVRHRFILHGGGFRNRWLALWYPLWMIRLTGYLLLQRPELVWAANFETALPAAVASLFTRCEYVYYIHDNVCLTYSFPLLTEGVLRPLDRFAVRRASAVIIPDASRFESHMKEYAKKFLVLPNSPRRGLGVGRRRPEGAPDYDILVTGSLWESRGIRQLLTAAERVGARVLVAGSIHEEGVRLAIASCSLAEYIGQVSHDQALALYDRCSSVLAFYDPAVPINVNASPTKLYEAMMMSTPVIMNAEVGMSSRVIEWGVGYVCDYGDIEGLASIIEEIRSNPGECESMGAAARSIFDVHFAWEILERQLLEVLETVRRGEPVVASNYQAHGL